MTGTLYFVQEDHSGPIKIGFTKSLPSCRLNIMQVGNPRRLQLLAVIPGCTRQDEERWHRQFAEVRLVGEWFHPTAALLQAIIESGQPPRNFSDQAPGVIKAQGIKDMGRTGWISPRARKHLIEKQREAAP
jgi:hypothetical protein